LERDAVYHGGTIGKHSFSKLIFMPTVDAEVLPPVT